MWVQITQDYQQELYDEIKRLKKRVAELEASLDLAYTWLCDES